MFRYNCKLHLYVQLPIGTLVKKLKYIIYNRLVQKEEIISFPFFCPGKSSILSDLLGFDCNDWALSRWVSVSSGKNIYICISISTVVIIIKNNTCHNKVAGNVGVNHNFPPADFLYMQRNLDLRSPQWGPLYSASRLNRCSIILFLL